MHVTVNWIIGEDDAKMKVKKLSLNVKYVLTLEQQETCVPHTQCTHRARWGWKSFEAHPK